MFTLTIQVSSIEEAERILAALKHSADPVAVAQVQDQVGVIEPQTSDDLVSNGVQNDFVSSSTPAPKKRGRPPKAANESAAPAVDVPAEVTASTADHSNGPEPAQQTLSIDDARKALMGVQAKYGTADMSKPLEVLARFGACRISEVPAEKYADFIAECKAA